MSEGSGPGPPGAGAVQTSPTVAPSDIVTVWLEKAAGPKSAIPLKSSMKKSFSAANVTSHSGRPSSVRSPPRVSISPTTSLTASIGAQLAKHAAYLSSAAARARTNILLRSSETDSAAGLTAQRYRGITGIKAWGKGVILKAYQARVQREKGFRKPLHPGEGDSHDQTVKERIHHAIESGPAIIFILVVTLFALFEADIKVAGAGPEADTGFFAATLFCIACFVVEIVLHSYVLGRKYIGGFYFWLDVIATFTLLLDIKEARLRVMSAIMGEEDGAGSVFFKQAGKVTKVGSKVQIIVRLIRLIRILKLYREMEARNRRQSRMRELQRLRSELDPDEVPITDMSARHVGEKLMDITTRKVIVGLLIVIVPMPLFDVTFWTMWEKPNILDTGIRMLHDLAANCMPAAAPVAPHTYYFPPEGVPSAPPAPAQAQAPALAPVSDPQSGMPAAQLAPLPPPECYQTLLRSMDSWVSFAQSTHVKVGALYVYGVDYSSRYGFPGYKGLLSTYRKSELSFSAYGNGGGLSSPTLSYVGVNMRNIARYEAGLNIGRTSFICFILLLGSHQLSRDSEKYVMRPLRHVVSVVTKMAENPALTGLRGLRDVAQRARGGMKTASTSPHIALVPPPKWKELIFRAAPWFERYLDRREAKRAAEDQKRDDNTFETTVIEARIRKICATLASSLGEAGTEILARNIRACKNHLEYENAGRRVVAVFAHVRILGFSELADSLREQVIPLANAIGLQVHLAAALSGGSANRIVGGEFQLVWKFPDEVSEEDLARCASVGAPICGEDVSSVADSALLSLIKAIVNVTKTIELEGYRHLPEVEVVGGIRLAVGLHAGWAVEGVVGSIFKTDATFLSSHADLPAKLAIAAERTKAGVIMSSDFSALLSPDIFTTCRQIDEVHMRDFPRPVGLVAFDCDPSLIAVPLFAPSTLNSTSHGAGAGTFQRHPSVFNEILFDDDDMSFDHPDVLRMHNVDAAFLNAFNYGYKCFREGNWDHAKRTLEKCVVLRPASRKTDGPSEVLLAFMSAHRGRPPPDWEGTRNFATEMDITGPIDRVGQWSSASSLARSSSQPVVANGGKRATEEADIVVSHPRPAVAMPRMSTPMARFDDAVPLSRMTGAPPPRRAPSPPPPAARPADGASDDEGDGTDGDSLDKGRKWYASASYDALIRSMQQQPQTSAAGEEGGARSRSATAADDEGGGHAVPLDAQRRPPAAASATSPRPTVAGGVEEATAAAAAAADITRE